MLWIDSDLDIHTDFDCVDFRRSLFFQIADYISFSGDSFEYKFRNGIERNGQKFLNAKIRTYEENIHFLKILTELSDMLLKMLHTTVYVHNMIANTVFNEGFKQMKISINFSSKYFVGNIQQARNNIA